MTKTSCLRLLACTFVGIALTYLTPVLCEAQSGDAAKRSDAAKSAKTPSAEKTPSATKPADSAKATNSPQPAPTHPGALVGKDADEAARLASEIERLWRAGDAKGAADAARKVAELRISRQGKKHWETVTATWEQRTADILASKGKDDLESYVQSFEGYQTASALKALGQYAAAQPIYEKTLQIHQRLLGEDHPDIAEGYSVLALNLLAQGKYSEAQPLIEKALDIAKRTLGADHPRLATYYGNYAVILIRQSKYAQAQPLLDNALEIGKRVLGESHPRTLQFYEYVAANLQAQGKYAQAQSLFEKVLEVRKRVLGNDDPSTANGYNSVASILDDQGMYAQAQTFYQQALEIRRRVLGDDHPTTAGSYNNVAFNLNEQGKFVESQPIFERALEISKRVLGENHPDTARCYNNVAANLASQRKYAEAQPLYEKALDIDIRALGENHDSTGRDYNNVGINLVHQRKYDQAQPLLQKALEICKRVLGENHPTTATNYGNLAANLNEQGNYTAAQPLFEKALEIDRRIFGENHPLTAQSYATVAVNLTDQGKYERAWDTYQHAAHAFAHARDDVAFAGHERAVWSASHSPLSGMAAVGAVLNHAAEAWQALETDLGRGLWDDVSMRAANIVPSDERQRLQDAEQELRRLDQVLLQELPKAVRAQAIQERSAAAIKLGELQSALLKAHGSLGGQSFDLATIQASLPADAALVAWLDLSPEPMAVDPDGDHWAVVVRKQGQPMWIDLPGTGPNKAWIDADHSLAKRLRSSLIAGQGENWITLAKELRNQRIAPLAKALGATSDGMPTVRHLIALPSPALATIPLELLRTPDDAWTVSLAPSGTVYAWLMRRGKSPAAPRTGGLLALGDPLFRDPPTKDKGPPLPPHGLLVNLVAPESSADSAGIKSGDVLLSYNGVALLQAANLRVVAEGTNAELVAVEVWRDGQTTTHKMRPGRLGVVLDQNPAPVALAEKHRIDAALLAARRGGENYSPLPATAWEVASLERKAKQAGLVTRTLLGRDASETKLHELATSNQLAKYRYIHLATHGVIDEQSPGRSAVIVTQIGLPDPLAAALAHQPIYDGRVSVDEIRSQWRLDADLVTLSACETALGKQEGGEGLVGFTQALLLAGTDAVCVSLWKVDDTATALLMDRFYANLLGQREGLKSPLPKGAALREAQSWLRSLTVAEATKHAAQLTQGVVRGAGQKTTIVAAPTIQPSAASSRPYSHPTYWAPFVLVGRTE